MSGSVPAVTEPPCQGGTREFESHLPHFNQKQLEFKNTGIRGKKLLNCVFDDFKFFDISCVPDKIYAEFTIPRLRLTKFEWIVLNEE